MTQVLLGANVAVFIAMLLASSDPSAFANPLHQFTTQLSRHFGANDGRDTLMGEWWRLLTYMFLHGSVLHILFNMWCLWDLGSLCESLYGRVTYAAVYLITGVAAGVASVGWNPGVSSVGASGAIFGLAGALISSFYLGEFSLPSFAIRGTLKSLVAFAAFNLFLGRAIGGVDNAAHIGGLVSGLILGALITKVAPQQDVPVRRAGVIAITALAVLATGLGVRRWRSPQMRTALTFQALGGQGGDPVARLKMLVEQNPNLAPAHFALAQAYFEQQKFPEAEAEFKKVIELQPKSARARFDLGMTYLSMKRAEEAKAAFDGMLQQGANTGEAHYGIAMALAMESKHPDAINEFKAAIKDGSDMSGIYSEMGNSYAQLRMYDDAISAYLKEKEKSGDNPDVENALADAYQAKGMTKEAQEARNQAAQLKNEGTGH
ncbi:MAG TPA: rhomboid family intramembrane serine protease [Candidatus Sulfotelmatobacter sp.]|nr:rhomboid family intramembrane serine protease [Candidatus Sulfotelmatobacter sp.]